MWMLTGLFVKPRPRHQIHQHVGLAAIDGDLVAVHIGRPVAGLEQDGIKGALAPCLPFPLPRLAPSSPRNGFAVVAGGAGECAHPGMTGGCGENYPLPPRCPRLRSIVISAKIDIAISSGVMAPRSRPAGALMRSSADASMPSAISLSRSAAILRRRADKAGEGGT